VPKITAITLQKKKKARYNVFLDEKFAFGIEAELLLKRNLKIGQGLTQKDLEKITKEDKLGSLINKSLNFLSYRPRSQSEVEDYLAKKIAEAESVKFSDAKHSAIITQVVNKLKKYKYINDYEFAKWFVQSRLKSNPKGSKLIILELKRKKIDPSILEKVQNFFPDQKSQALKALQRRLDRLNKLPKLEFKKKVYMYLGSRGFDSETIRETIAFLEKNR